MKTTTITYTYDPTARALNLFVEGKLKGGFIGKDAESRFARLLETGAEVTITNMNTGAYKKILIRRFHAALAAQGIMAHKESILQGYGVEHTTDLTIDQLKQLLATYGTEGKRPMRAEDPANIRALRSDILVILNKMGIYATNNDWTAVNEFCLKHTGKMLYQMKQDELVKARKQFNKLLDWHTGKMEEINRLKINN